MSPSVGSAGIVQSISTGGPGCFLDCFSALRCCRVSLSISFLGLIGMLPAVLRTPAAARAQAMQNGGFFGPNEYTRQSAQKELPQERQVFSDASNGCFAQRPSIGVSSRQREGGS